jgi:hypothetical protein
VHDVPVTLDRAQRGHLDRGAGRDAADVVAGEVDEHRVLRELLRIGLQVLLQERVVARILRPRSRARDRTRDHLVATHAHEQFRRCPDERRMRSHGGEVEIEEVRGRVDAPQ